jgi:hypothetical protein
MKRWVVIKEIKTGNIKAWRDHNDDHVWGAASYEVIGYYNGSYKDARRFGNTHINGERI